MCKHQSQEAGRDDGENTLMAKREGYESVIAADLITPPTAGTVPD